MGTPRVVLKNNGTITSSYQNSDATDVIDYRRIVVSAKFASKGAQATITLQIQVTTVASGDEADEDWAALATEVITAGVGAQSDYEAEFDISGLTAPFTLNPLSAPIEGAQRLRVRYKGDAAGPDGSITISVRKIT